ncbi:MAG: hypothetical protein QN174_02515 [Armatimonadota bacterium]|nr:hypothetical protein [Armatimonadota bacterium]MDR7457854.1 hypothetical protein [Armatimonadota bacterium]MDR7495822.1 hypothetical protein [Armatimonadota bacterium]MDR7511479.1 hypothetical protein [Armatimonadota bacterium]
MAVLSAPSRRLVVEVLAPGLAGLGLPRLAAEARSRRPRPGDVGGEEAYRVLDLLDRLHCEFGSRVEVYLIEPLSWAWIVRVLRYRPRRYPVFLVGGAVLTGLNEGALLGHVARLLGVGRIR